jgi:hypothetical protein
LAVRIYGTIARNSGAGTQHEGAIEMTVFVVQAFVCLRDMLGTNPKVACQLVELDRRLRGHAASMHAIIDRIHERMAEPRKMRTMGFRVPGP